VNIIYVCSLVSLGFKIFVGTIGFILNKTEKILISLDSFVTIRLVYLGGLRLASVDAGPLSCVGLRPPRYSRLAQRVARTTCNDLEQRGMTYCLVSRNKKQSPEQRMGRVRLGALKTSMQTDGLTQEGRDAFGC
jgi:hypothetical protein